MESEPSDDQAPLEEQEEGTQPSPDVLNDTMAKTGLTPAIAKKPEATNNTIISPKSLSPTASSTRTLSPPSSAPPPTTQRSLTHNPPGNREIEDMKAKLRIMEKKRMEDREKLKGLERLQGERDKFEAIIQKLQNKYQPQQQELADLRKQLKEADERVQHVERQDAEHETEVEMATLDREMAEETAESLKTELEALKLKHEEMELEVEVLREENHELGSTISPEERSSQGWLQMEKEKERLREALVRLRDMTQQSEAELRSQIKELEEDVREYGTVRSTFEATKEKLLHAEANVEDLREQLDSALGAEEMIEELTERNTQYQTQVENLKVAIEDLESLKELNDELEINHMETEKQLQDEIDFKDSVFSEQSRKAVQQDEVIEDLEYTLSRFRELTTNMQADLEDIRASQQISEAEASDLTTKSRAMMDLNLKLQNSAAKAQVKTIEVGMARMKAEESETHLSIVQQYLPGMYAAEKDPILALLRFKRVAFKSSLLHSLVRERTTDHALGAHDNIFVSYEVLEKLTAISGLCDRFVNFVGGCSVEAFAKFEGALYELEPVERGLNLWLDGLKKNELDAQKCAIELQRSIALLTHLAEKLITPNIESQADEMQGSAFLVQSSLESVVAALSNTHHCVQSKVATENDNDEEVAHFGQKIDSIVAQSRSAKVIVGKVGRALQDLRSRSLALSGDHLGAFENAERAGREIAEFSRRLGEDVLAALNEEGRSEEYALAEVHKIMSTSTISFFQRSAIQPSTEDALSILTAKIRSLYTQLEELTSLSSDLSRAMEFERQPAPWFLRAQELKSAKVISPDTEEEIRRLKTDVQERSAALAVRDKTLEEQGIKIEMLESRQKDAGKKATMAKELEIRLEDAKAREKELTSTMERHLKDHEHTTKERNEYRSQLDKLKRASGTTAVAGEKGGVLGPQHQAASLASVREVESLRREIASLQAAVRFLREENHRATMPDVQRAGDAWLRTPLVRPKPDAKAQRMQRNAAEAQDVLNHLLALTKETRVLDLSTALPKEGEKRLAWRPAKTTPRYQAVRLREEYESWVEWKDDFLRRERGQKRPAVHRIQRRSKMVEGAEVNGSVQIVGSP